MTTITCTFDEIEATKEIAEVAKARAFLEQAESIMRGINYTVSDYAVDAIETAIKMAADVEDDLNNEIDAFEERVAA